MTSPSLRSWNLRDLNAALEALGDFANVVLEAAQRLDLAVEHDRRVANDAHLGVARDLAARDVAADDRSDLADLEDLRALRRVRA